MKERITAIITLSCIFSLFFYYKIYSSDDLQTVNYKSVSTESVVNKIVEKIENETLKNKISDSTNDIQELTKNSVCSLDQEKLDSMTFSESFKYNRECNGKGTLFTWKNNEYSTLFASEKLEEIKNKSNLASESPIKKDEVNKFQIELEKATLSTTIGNNN